MITEPLEAPKMKMFNGVKKNDGKTMKKMDKEKELIKYYKDLKRIILAVNKDILKDNSYVTKHLYKIVGQYKKATTQEQNLKVQHRKKKVKNYFYSLVPQPIINTQSCECQTQCNTG
jgi:hypothetical protein